MSLNRSQRATERQQSHLDTAQVFKTVSVLSVNRQKDLMSSVTYLKDCLPEAKAVIGGSAIVSSLRPFFFDFFLLIEPRQKERSVSIS